MCRWDRLAWTPMMCAVVFVIQLFELVICCRWMCVVSSNCYDELSARWVTWVQQPVHFPASLVFACAALCLRLDEKKRKKERWGLVTYNCKHPWSTRWIHFLCPTVLPFSAINQSKWVSKSLVCFVSFHVQPKHCKQNQIHLTRRWTFEMVSKNKLFVSNQLRFY